MTESKARHGRESNGPMRAALFRFASVYFVIFVLPFPIGWIPYLEPLSAQYFLLRDALVTAISRHLLGITIQTGPMNGSGDTALAYAWMLCNFFLALLCAAIWTGVARRAPAEQTKGAMCVAVRYYLASAMLAYGTVKIFQTQFPPLQPSDLATTYGESSPMGLLWRFMSFSRAYAAFGGALEVLGALLLFHRRTTVLGALLSTGVLAHVVMLNLCFDVPVKIYSAHLLVMALALVLPHARTLLDLFVLGRPGAIVPPPALAPQTRRRRIGLGVVKAAVVGAMVLVSFFMAHQGSVRPVVPLEGTWEVVAIEHGEVGAAVRPNLPSTLLWRRVTIDPRGFVTFDTDGKRRRWQHLYAEAEQTLRLNESEGGALATASGAAPLDATSLDLQGVVAGKPTRVRMRRVEPSEMVLVSRGFHWVNEVPYWR